MNARAKDRSSVYTDIARAYAEQVVTGEILLARELARADVFLDLVDCADPIQRLIGQHRLGRPGVEELPPAMRPALRVLECLGVWPADANANFRRLPPGAAHQSLWLLLFLHHRHDSLSPIGDDGVNCCSAPGGGNGPDQLVVETTGPLAGLGDGTFAGADGCFLLAMLTGDDRRERAPNSHHITSDALQIAALRAAEGVAVAHRCRQSHPAQDRPEKGIFASGGLHGLTNSWKSTLSQGCKFLPRLDYGARRAESGWATGNESRVLGACHIGKWARTVVLPWNTCWHTRKQCARSKPMRWNEWRRTPETAGFFAAEWTIFKRCQKPFG